MTNAGIRTNIPAPIFRCGVSRTKSPDGRVDAVSEQRDEDEDQDRVGGLDLVLEQGDAKDVQVQVEVLAWFTHAPLALVPEGVERRDEQEEDDQAQEDAAGSGR